MSIPATPTQKRFVAQVGISSFWGIVAIVVEPADVVGPASPGMTNSVVVGPGVVVSLDVDVERGRVERVVGGVVGAVVGSGAGGSVTGGVVGSGSGGSVGGGAVGGGSVGGVVTTWAPTAAAGASVRASATASPTTTRTTRTARR